MPKVSRIQKLRTRSVSASSISRVALLSPKTSTPTATSTPTPTSTSLAADVPANDVNIDNTISTGSANDETLAATNSNSSNNNNNATKSALSRGQRKRQAKREQYLKREKMILSTLKLQKMEEQKSRIDGLDAIKEALIQTIKENQQKKEELEKANNGTTHDNVVLKTNKLKKNVAEKEMNHLNLVLQHPSFKSNPFATMQEHLRNTLAGQAKEQEAAASKERKEEEAKAQERKEAKKERIRNFKYEKGRKQRRFRR